MTPPVLSFLTFTHRPCRRLPLGRHPAIRPTAPHGRANAEQEPGLGLALRIDGCVSNRSPHSVHDAPCQHPQPCVAAEPQFAEPQRALYSVSVDRFTHNECSMLN